MYVFSACCFYVCCSDCVGVYGKVCCVAAVVKDSIFTSLGMLKYVVCLCKGCDGCCVFVCIVGVELLVLVYGKCECFIMHMLVVSCVHLVAVLNSA